MYIDNNELQQELSGWKTLYDKAMADGQEVPRISEKLGAYILEIARNYAKKHKFRDSTYIDEMIGDAVLETIKGLKGFKPDTVLTTGNAPAFFFITMKVHQAFIRRIPIEQNQQQIKNKSLIEHHTIEELQLEAAGGHLGGGDNQPDFIQTIYNDHYDRYTAYEVKMGNKRDSDRAKKPYKCIKPAESPRDTEDIM